MFVTELIYALSFGLAIALLLGSTLGTRGPWNNIFWFFCVIFLFSWGGGLWLTPFGPTGWGVSWMPFLVVGVFITLLLSAATPRSARGRMTSDGKATDGTAIKALAGNKMETETALDAFFWILIVSLAAVIVCHYIWNPHHIMSHAA